MQDIDFEKFYHDFDLENFLSEPTGRFERSEMKDILNACTNPKGIAMMAGFYGIRQAISKELLKVRDDAEWKKKIHYLQDEEAQEIFCRLWFMDRIKRFFNK